MIGIVILSNCFKFEVEDLNVIIFDMCKIMLLICLLEKLVVKLGGCDNYCFGFFDWIMIKDNYIDVCSSIMVVIEWVVVY